MYFFRSRNFCYSQTQHKSLRISNFIHVQLSLLFKNLFHVFQSSSNMVWPFSVSFLRLSAVFDITRQSPTISYLFTMLSGANSSYWPLKVLFFISLLCRDVWYGKKLQEIQKIISEFVTKVKFTKNVMTKLAF